MESDRVSRLFTEDRLVIASHNPGKAREIADLLRPFGVATVSAADLDLPEPEETGRTFIENALIKSRSAAEKSGIPALADDSGLVVSALNGEPGIYSARWAGPEKDFDLAMRRVEENLEGQGDRSAKFVCVLGLAGRSRESPMTDLRGRGRGRFGLAPRGEKGSAMIRFSSPQHDANLCRDRPGGKARHKSPGGRLPQVDAILFRKTNERIKTHRSKSVELDYDR